MSKIQDTILQIEQFLSSDDQSMTPKLIRLAADYAEGCRQLNCDLADCRKQIDRGALLEAKERNRAFHPPLTERWRMLNFPKREAWCALCRLYQLNIPSPLDDKTAETLLEEESERERDAAALILEWPRVAREGTLREKVLLLRRILASGAPGKATWNSNLTSLEKAYLDELYREAKSACAQNDGERLEAIHRELCSPELREAPDSEVMEKIASAIRAIQERRLKERMNALLDALSGAYAEMDAAKLETLLQQWHMLVSHPLARPDEAAQNVLKEIHAFLEKKKRDLERKENFQKLRAELIDKLDTCASFSEVNRIFQAMKLLELPLEKALVTRVEALEDEHRRETTRRHVRHSLYGVCASLLVAGLTFLAIQIWQFRRALSTSENSLKQLIAKKNYAGALAFCDTLAAKNPRVAASERIAALKEEAGEQLRNQEKQRESSRKEFSYLAGELERTLTPETFAPERVAELLADAEKLYEQLDEKERVLLQHFKTVRTQLEEQRRRDLEKRFVAHTTELTSALSAIEESLTDASRLAQAEKDAAGIAKKYDSLEKENRALNAALLARCRQAFDLQYNAFQSKLKRETNHFRTVRNLTAPPGIFEYLEALEQLPVHAPELEAEYRIAAARLPLYRAMHAMNFISGAPKPDANLESSAFSGPYQLDMKQYLRPEPDLSALVAKILANLTPLREQFEVSGDFYELIFQDNQGGRYYFYSEKAPRIERSRNTHAVRELLMDVVTEAGQLGKPTVIQVRMGNGSVRYSIAPDDLKEWKLPQEFASCENWTPLRPEEFSKSRHLAFLNELTSKLRQTKSHDELETILLRHLRQLAADSDMNPAMQQPLLRKLLLQLPLLSHFYEPVVEKTADICGVVPEEINQDWCNPDIAFSQQGRQFHEIRASFPAKLERLQAEREFLGRFFRALLSRRISPAAVVVRTESLSYKFHKLRESPPTELFLVSRETAGTIACDRLRLLPSKLWNEGNDLPVLLGKECFAGQVIYASDLAEPCEEFFAKWKAEGGKLEIELNPALLPENLP